MYADHCMTLPKVDEGYPLPQSIARPDTHQC